MYLSLAFSNGIIFFFFHNIHSNIKQTIDTPASNRILAPATEVLIKTTVLAASLLGVLLTTTITTVLVSGEGITISALLQQSSDRSR